MFVPALSAGWPPRHPLHALGPVRSNFPAPSPCHPRPGKRTCTPDQAEREERQALCCAVPLLGSFVLSFFAGLVTIYLPTYLLTLLGHISRTTSFYTPLNSHRSHSPTIFHYTTHLSITQIILLAIALSCVLCVTRHLRCVCKAVGSLRRLVRPIAT